MILSVLAVMVILFGLWPAPLIDMMHPSINSLVEHLSRSKYLADEIFIILPEITLVFLTCIVLR